MPPLLDMAKSAMTKFELVREIVGQRWPGDISLLDVGCRGCELAPHVKDLARYQGVDLFQNPRGTVDFVHDVSKGLPMADGAYDVVVGLDILEHLDDLRSGLDELVRVARRGVIVLLPNIAHVFFRYHFALSGRIGAKYDLTYGQGQDRHRWLTVLPQCDAFMRDYCRDKGLGLEILWFNDSPKKRLMGKVFSALRLPASMWVWASVYVVDKCAPAAAIAEPSTQYAC